MYRKILLFGSALVALVALSLTAHGDYDVHYYIMDDYNVDDRCLYRDLDMYGILSEYMDEMSTRNWSSTLKLDNVIAPYFFDPDLMTYAWDYLYLDEGDIGIITSHGGVNGSNQFTIRMSRYNSETASCYVTPESQMELGEPANDISWLHLTGCRSMHIDDDVFHSWRDVFHGIHQIHGFHGLNWSTGLLEDPFGDFAAHSHNSAIARNWINDLYLEDWHLYPPEGEYIDLCPVAYTGRDSLNEADTILDNEIYPTPGGTNWAYVDEYSPTYWRKRWIDGCDPAEGSEL